MGRGRSIAIRIGTIAAIAPGCAAPLHAAGKELTVALFSGLQEQPPFSPEEMAARHKDAEDDPEGIAADTALNDWKLCVLDSLNHWAELGEGPGTLVDGAFGRCADVERSYRLHLQQVTQNGRAIVDVQMARAMTRSLEEIWRPRLIAAALDQALAAKRARPTPVPPGTTRPGSPG